MKARQRDETQRPEPPRRQIPSNEPYDEVANKADAYENLNQVQQNTDAGYEAQQHDLPH